MADNVMTENEEDELIPVETQPDGADGDDTNDGAEEDEEDDRLAASEDDSEDDITSNRRRRERRRDRQRKARDEAERQINMLKQQNAEMLRRLSAVEGHAVNTNAKTLDERLSKAQRDIQQAEHFIAKATEAGNGDDVVAAMRIRDQAIAEAQQLAGAKQQLNAARQQAATPRVDPAVVNYAKEWMSANPWYDPTGRDRDSAVTKAIDNELVQEGFNPSSREYWEELTSRVAEAIGDDEPSAKPRKRGPPTGNTREHAPVSTKKQIYVTPERKQAMIDAGVWDDPVQRQRYLKAYQAYDSSAR